MSRSFQNIALPIDFSDASASAFTHALRIVLATRGRLNLVHTADAASFDNFPHIRHTLALWKLMNENDAPAAVSRLGIKVAKTTLSRDTPLPNLMQFLEVQATDLLVLTTHGRDGIAHWLQGSIAETLSNAARIPTLFIPSNARGFVDQWSSELHLSRILMPIDHSPSPTEAFDTVRTFARSLNQPTAHIDLMHVGKVAPFFDVKTIQFFQ